MSGLRTDAGVLRREKILDAIEELTERRGFPPTIRELCQEVGVTSTSTVVDHLDILKRYGFVTWEPGQPRTIRVLRPDSSTVEQPIRNRQMGNGCEGHEPQGRAFESPSGSLYYRYDSPINLPLRRRP